MRAISPNRQTGVATHVFSPSEQLRETGSPRKSTSGSMSPLQFGQDLVKVSEPKPRSGISCVQPRRSSCGQPHRRGYQLGVKRPGTGGRRGRRVAPCGEPKAAPGRCPPRASSVAGQKRSLRASSTTSRHARADQTGIGARPTHVGSGRPEDLVQTAHG